MRPAGWKRADVPLGLLGDAPDAAFVAATDFTAILVGGEAIFTEHEAHDISTRVGCRAFALTLVYHLGTVAPSDTAVGVGFAVSTTNGVIFHGADAVLGLALAPKIRDVAAFSFQGDAIEGDVRTFGEAILFFRGTDRRWWWFITCTDFTAILVGLETIGAG